MPPSAQCAAVDGCAIHADRRALIVEMTDAVNVCDDAQRQGTREERVLRADQQVEHEQTFRAHDYPAPAVDVIRSQQEGASRDGDDRDRRQETVS